MYMNLNRSTYLMILIFLAVLYFSCFKNKVNKQIQEGFVVNEKKKDPCLECANECGPYPNYDQLCLSTAQACINCKNSKQSIIPKSWVTIEKNNDEIYDLSKNLKPEILIINQLINTDNNNTLGVQPPMTNIEISAHPNFDKLDYSPRNLITGMFTDTDPVPSNSTLQRMDVIDPKFKKL